MSDTSNKVEVPEDFQLSELQKFDPSVFLPDGKKEQDLAAFVLSLALAYNDMKAMLIYLKYIIRIAPKKAELTPHFGQSAGITNQIQRILISQLNEVLMAIEENKKLVETEEFRKLRNGCSPVCKEAWDTLLNIALHKTFKLSSDQKRVKLFLTKIRNNITYHYNQPKGLYAGYKAIFSEDRPEVEFAMASIGNDLESTRFFFADAAAQGFVEILTSKEESDTMLREAEHLTTKINTGLFGIVSQYIQARQKHLSKTVTEPEQKTILVP